MLSNEVVAGTPFVIVYRVRKERVEVLAVLHASRQFPIMGA
ncbi:MAG: type II toxin-antitoxin system RelE/ParE family toxin [Elusimicrobia bacterium]|nr:type II toxin-antitoxin system RelE/ParE family toxin [Elusimicrobiota bacterium]